MRRGGKPIRQHERHAPTFRCFLKTHRDWPDAAGELAHALLSREGDLPRNDLAAYQELGGVDLPTLEKLWSEYKRWRWRQ
jgi:hypothetical protein